jgi:endonuclease/exonuclease/phosphatase family metal-dependent hydrolase
MWELLRKMKPMLKDPWLVVGDFNEVTSQDEHFSLNKRGEKQMADFTDLLSHCDLHDLGFKGLPWTFDNRQIGQGNVRVRLDRAVAEPSWLNLFPKQ